MKFFNVGDNSDLVIEMEMANKQNKFGSMYYFEKIQLATTIPVADYNVWKSADGQNFLCVRHEAAIRDELVKIIETIKKGHVHLKFKDLDVKAMYFKVGAPLAGIIPLNENLNIVIQIYGVFHQKSVDMAYLQMEIVKFSV
jgi:hypothetical protein